MGLITMDCSEAATGGKFDNLNILVVDGPLKNSATLKIGNPHIVFFIYDMRVLDVAALAQSIQNDPMFPEQINAGVAQIADAERFLLAICARPGIPMSVRGSWGRVALQPARLLGLPDSRRAKVEITLDDQGHAILAGSVDYCFSGRVPGQEGRLA